MRISLLSSDTDRTPQTLDVTWQDHVDGLSKCREVECPRGTFYTEGEGDSKRKIEIPSTVCPSLTRHPATAERLPNKCQARKVEAWSPAVFNGVRGDSNVIGMGCIVLDLDHLKAEALNALLARVDALGWCAIMHSTHSHDPDRDDHCYRLVLQPTRELTAAEVKPTRDWVQAQLGMRADEQTKNLERIYYLPTRPKNGPAYVFASTEGTLIEPVTSAVTAGPSGGFLSQLSGSVARGTEPAPLASSGTAGSFPERVDGDMKALRSSLARVQTDLVRRMLAGTALAESGGRDTALQSLAGFLAFKLPTASVEAMVELARASVTAMDPPETGDWLSSWREKVERACERKAEADAATKERNAIAASAFRFESAKAAPDEDAPDNTGPFDAARVERWALQHGCSNAGEFQKQWIVRHHGGNWIFCNGRYRSMVPDKDIDISVRRDLARAPVQLMTTNAAGEEVQRPMKSILFEYATAARSVIASLSLRESYYDHRAECFHEAVCPIREELKPREHPEIHEWLKRFGGDTLLDWVACVTRLDKPAAALYIDGPPGTGKNVLADGLARLWHKGGASAFKDVIGSNFNDSLTRCPLIHADEGIPKTDTIIEDLRRLIGSNVCSLNRKFMPVVSLEGCPRLIITANNKRVLLDTGAQLGPHDIDAVTQRIRQVSASQSAADYLASFRETKGHSYIESWIKDDHVARHALWLADNRKVDERGRFLVSGFDPAQAEAMINGTGQVGAVMEFLARYLSDTGAMKTPKVRPGAGQLLVSTEALADRSAWERYVPSRKIPSARLISDSLRAVSENEPVTVDGLEFFNIKPHMLINWSRSNQVGSPVTIEAKINRTEAPDGSK